MTRAYPDFKCGLAEVAALDGGSDSSGELLNVNSMRRAWDVCSGTSWKMGDEGGGGGLLAKKQAGQH